MQVALRLRSDPVTFDVISSYCALHRGTQLVSRVLIAQNAMKTWYRITFQNKYKEIKTALHIANKKLWSSPTKHNITKLLLASNHKCFSHFLCERHSTNVKHVLWQQFLLFQYWIKLPRSNTYPAFAAWPRTNVSLPKSITTLNWDRQRPQI